MLYMIPCPYGGALIKPDLNFVPITVQSPVGNYLCSCYNLISMGKTKKGKMLESLVWWWRKKQRRRRRTKEKEGEMMMMSAERQRELNLLISQSGKKAT